MYVYLFFAHEISSELLNIKRGIWFRGVHNLQRILKVGGKVRLLQGRVLGRVCGGLAYV